MPLLWPWLAPLSHCLVGWAGETLALNRLKVLRPYREVLEPPEAREGLHLYREVLKPLEGLPPYSQV